MTGMRSQGCSRSEQDMPARLLVGIWTGRCSLVISLLKLTAVFP